MKNITRLTKVLCLVLVLVVVMLGTLAACQKEDEKEGKKQAGFAYIKESHGGYIAHIARAPGDILRFYPDSYILYLAPYDGNIDEEMVEILVNKNTDCDDPDWLVKILSERKTGDKVIALITSDSGPISEMHPRLYEAGFIDHLRGDAGDPTAPIVYEGTVLHVAKATGKIAEAHPDSYILYVAPTPGTTYTEEVQQFLINKDTVWEDPNSWEYLLGASHSGEKIRVTYQADGDVSIDPLYFGLYFAEKCERIDEG